MRQTVRLFWRTARFEILAGLVLTVALTGALLAVAATLDSIRFAECGGTINCPTSAWYDLDNTWAQPLMSALALWPFVVGLLYGPLVVGRELDRRTAPLAWSLAPGRLGWLLWRIAPVLLLVLVLLIGPAFAAIRLEMAHLPLLDPAQSFMDHGLYGPLVVARGMAVFAVGVAAGVVFGRLLPAVLATAAICLIGLVIAGALVPVWMPREEIPLEVVNGLTRESPLIFGDGYRLPDGRLLTFSESEPLRPPEARQLDTAEYRTWLRDSGWTRVEIGIRGSRIGDIVLREGALTLGFAVVALGVAGVLVRRRRPVPGIAPELDAIRARTDTDRQRRTSPAWRRVGPWLSWRMTARVGRPELLGTVVAALVVTGAALAWTWLLAQARIEQGCVDTECIGTGQFSRVRNPLDDWLYPPLAALPFVVGCLLGAPLVAREFEARSAQLTFSLAPSRVRWLVWRALIPAVLIVVLLAPAAVASSRLFREVTLLDPSYVIWGDSIRGAGLVARGVAAFGLAVLAGVATRRVLPALVIAAVCGIFLYNALDWALPRWVPAEPVATEEEAPGSYGVGMIVRAPDGSLYDPRELAISLGIPGRGPEGTVEFHDWLETHEYEMMAFDVPARRYPEIVMRESLTLVTIGVASLGVAAVLLRERRPA